MNRTNAHEEIGKVKGIVVIRTKLEIGKELKKALQVFVHEMSASLGVKFGRPMGCHPKNGARKEHCTLEHFLLP